MLIRFNCRRMIAIFPVGSFPALSLIELLSRPSSNQLDGSGYYVSATIIPDKKVNVIRGHRVIEHDKAITLLRLKKPPQPSAPVSGKLEKETPSYGIDG
jgi:hypothetical protein